MCHTNRPNQRIWLNYLKISEIFAGRESSEGPDNYKKGTRCYIRIGYYHNCIRLALVSKSGIVHDLVSIERHYASYRYCSKPINGLYYYQRKICIA